MKESVPPPCRNNFWKYNHCQLSIMMFPVGFFQKIQYGRYQRAIWRRQNYRGKFWQDGNPFLLYRFTASRFYFDI